MEPTISTITPFTASNVKKCICGSCPVQMDSQCIKEKQATVKESLAKNPLLAVDMPGLYCSIGTATCKDIDTKQICICGSCPVFTDYQLATHQPMGYYCRDGLAT